MTAQSKPNIFGLVLHVLSSGMWSGKITTPKGQSESSSERIRSAFSAIPPLLVSWRIAMFVAEKHVHSLQTHSSPSWHLHLYFDKRGGLNFLFGAAIFDSKLFMSIKEGTILGSKRSSIYLPPL